MTKAKYVQARPRQCCLLTQIKNSLLIHNHNPIFLFEFVTIIVCHNNRLYRFINTTSNVTTFFTLTLKGNCVVFKYEHETAIQGQATLSP